MVAVEMEERRGGGGVVAVGSWGMAVASGQRAKGVHRLGDGSRGGGGLESGAVWCLAGGGVGGGGGVCWWCACLGAADGRWLPSPAHGGSSSMGCVVTGRRGGPVVGSWW